MISRDLKTQAEFAQVAMAYPKIVQFLKVWEESELRKLPFNSTNFEVAQGRCQVLAELIKTFEQAPDMVESLKARPATHTDRSVNYDRTS